MKKGLTRSKVIGINCFVLLVYLIFRFFQNMEVSLQFSINSISGRPMYFGLKTTAEQTAYIKRTFMEVCFWQLVFLTVWYMFNAVLYLLAKRKNTDIAVSKKTFVPTWVIYAGIVVFNVTAISVRGIVFQQEIAPYTTANFGGRTLYEEMLTLYNPYLTLSLLILELAGVLIMEFQRKLSPKQTLYMTGCALFSHFPMLIFLYL